MKWLISLTILVICLIFGVLGDEQECPKNEKVIFCYYSSWAIYREGSGHFNTSYIDPHMCTHMIYAFAGLSIYGGIESMDTYNDYTLGGYQSFVALKEENPCLKTLLAIGGWNEGSRPYSVMVSDAGYRKAFIESVIRLLAVYNFDGLDIDWEYPTQRGGIAEDKANFGALLSEMKQMLKRWDLLLTIAVPTSVAIAQQAYDMQSINDHVDYVLIMGYDVTPTNSEVTGLSSPMTDIRNSVEFWAGSISKEKVVLGVPAYGRTFTLMNQAENHIGALTNGTGNPGLYTKESGFLSYYEVIINLQIGGYTKVLDETEQNYYAYVKDQWMTFELADNYEAKANFVMGMGIGGMMVWSIDTEDFTGSRNSTAFPIVKVIRKVLLGEE